jgi:Skp family chaperone for outer membrane proteins
MVLERSLAAQSIRVRIEELSKNIQRQMDLRTSDLKKLEQDILKKKGLINEKSYEEELLKFNKKISDLRREAQSSKGKIEQAYSEAINKLNEEISKIINELSNEHGFEVVLPAKLVIFSSPKLNITELIIERLNSRLQEIPVHYQG